MSEKNINLRLLAGHNTVVFVIIITLTQLKPAHAASETEKTPPVRMLVRVYTRVCIEK